MTSIRLSVFDIRQLKDTGLLSLGLGLSLGLSIPVHSQTQNRSESDSIRYRMSEVTVTANRYEKNAFETNLPVQTLSQAEIWERGFSHPSDAADATAGAAVTGTGPWSRRWTLRGLSGPRVLVLVNGQRLDIFRSYGEHPPLLDADQIRKIEIIRGPSSVLYGSDAVAGVVNYITESAVEGVRGRSRISGRIGGQFSSVCRQWNETVSLRGDRGRGFASVFLCRRTADDIRTPKGTLENTAFGGWTAQGDLGWRPSPASILTAAGQADRMGPVGIPIDPYASRARFLAYERNRIAASFRSNAAGGNPAGIRVDMYGQNEFRNFDAFIDHKPKGPNFVDQRQTGLRRVRAAGFSGHAAFVRGKTVMVAGADGFGLEIRSERIADTRLFNASGKTVADPPPDFTPPLPRSAQEGLGIFGNGETEIRPWMAVHAGLRFDGIRNRAIGAAGTLVETDRSEQDVSLSGGAGILLRLGKSLRITANAGRAFRAPALEERYFRGPGQAGFVTGDPGLRSETSLNLDLGLKWKTGRVEGELTAFSNRVDDLIVLKIVSATRDTSQYANVGRALLRGAEFRSAADLTGNLSIRADVSCVFAEDALAAEPLPMIPPVRGTLSVRIHGIPGGGMDPWHFEAGLRMVADQNRTAGNESRTPGYSLLDLAFGIGFNPKALLNLPMTATVSVKNAFNRSYRDHLSSVYWWDAPGRDVVVGLKVMI